MKRFLYFVFILVAAVSCTEIQEQEPTFEISDTLIQTDYEEFYGTIEVRSSEPYVIDMDSDWAAVTDIMEGVDFDTVTIYCSKNLTPDARNTDAVVRTNTDSKQIHIVQTGKEFNIEVVDNHMTASIDEPGTLYKMCREYFDWIEIDQEFGEEIWGDITSVTLSGTIDARDFSTLKWNFRNLQDVDLSDVKIAAYSGEYGTNEGYYDGGVCSVYNANEIPVGAFFYWQNNYIREFPAELNDEGMPSLRSVKLPEGIKVIRRNAFARAYNLKEINIPEGVETVEMVAFRYCMSIEKLYLPSTLKNVGWLAFTEMTSLKEVHIAATTMPTEEGGYGAVQAFGNRLDAYQIGGIEGQIWRGWVVDAEGYESSKEKTDAVLYVPVGSKDNYKDWEKYFVEIVEE